MDVHGVAGQQHVPAQSGRAARRAFCISFTRSTFRLAAATVI